MLAQAVVGAFDRDDDEDEEEKLLQSVHRREFSEEKRIRTHENASTASSQASLVLIKCLQ
jgi:hypothetical protein